MGEQTAGEVNQVFNFEVGMVKINEQRYNKWQVKTLKRKKMQIKLLKDFDDDEHKCCNVTQNLGKLQLLSTYKCR